MSIRGFRTDINYISADILEIVSPGGQDHNEADEGYQEDYMAEETKEKWLNYLALTTVVLAVCATLSTFKGGGFSTKAVLSQTQASNQWAYYQAKSIKGYVYEMQKEKLELEIKALETKNQNPVVNEYKEKIASYEKKITRYNEEKTQIEKDARRLETVKDDALKHSQAFGVAVIYLQIAILLSSIAALMKIRYVWIIGLVCGAAGLVYFVNGFFTFF